MSRFMYSLALSILFVLSVRADEPAKDKAKKPSETAVKTAEVKTAAGEKSHP